MTGIIFINIPISPLSKSIGKKAKTVVSVAAKTAGNISAAPTIAASLLSIPSSMCLYMFSATTIASSTSIPRAIKAPRSESILILSPINSVAIKPIIKLTGIPTATTIAIPRSIKINIDKKTSIKPKLIFANTVLRRFFIQIEVSV